MKQTDMERDRELFRQALIEAFARKYERELAACGETAECSEGHTQRMEEILRAGAAAERRRSRRKWIVALLAAAVLLMTACTVYAYHGEIRDFVEEVYEKHIKVSFDDGEEPTSEEVISEVYVLSYVPEGYELTDEIHSSITNKYTWTNAQNRYLIFEQRILTQSSFATDVENGETGIIQSGNYEIYHRITQESYHTYIWNDGKYAFKISVTEPLEEDELARIVDGIKSVQ